VNVNRIVSIVHDPDRLRDAWRELSLDRVWLRPNDWFTPEVDAVAEFLVAGGDAERALEALGAARAAAGVGLAEALEDLRCLSEVSPRSFDPWQSTQAVSRGWVEATAQDLRPAPLMDPGSDLATLAYISVRLREIYCEARQRRTKVALTHCLVIVDTAVTCTDPWGRLRRGMVLGAVFREVFDGGQPIASLGERSGAALAIVPRTRLLGVTLRQLRLALAERLGELQVEGSARDPIRVWVEALPADYDAALALIAELAR
jgi:hypothetical protein